LTRARERATLVRGCKATHDEEEASAMKIEFDFQQGMRSLGRMTRRAYDTVKDKAEEAADDGDADRDARDRDPAGAEGPRSEEARSETERRRTD
jgi:hypothetical protein